MSPVHPANVLGHLFGPTLWEDEQMLLPRLTMEIKKGPSSHGLAQIQTTCDTINENVFWVDELEMKQGFAGIKGIGVGVIYHTNTSLVTMDLDHNFGTHLDWIVCYTQSLDVPCAMHRRGCF